MIKLHMLFLDKKEKAFHELEFVVPEEDLRKVKNGGKILLGSCRNSKRSLNFQQLLTPEDE